jgi:hypothetical protein
MTRKPLSAVAFVVKSKKPSGYRWLRRQFYEPRTEQIWGWLLQDKIETYPRSIVCPFHDDTRPRAALIHDGENLPALLCYASSEHWLPEGTFFVTNIAETYYRMTNPNRQWNVDYLEKASQCMWATRLLLRAGMIKSPPKIPWLKDTTILHEHLRMKKCKLSTRGDWKLAKRPGISDRNLTKLYLTIREIAICKQLLHGETETALAGRFVRDWSGLSHRVVANGISLLRKVELLTVMETAVHQDLSSMLLGRVLAKDKRGGRLTRLINVYQLTQL